jgi:large subunit ribosomal protein L21
MMFAVIKTGGKQYKVQKGDVLQVEKLDLSKDQAITFEEVLLVEDGKTTLIGTPFVDKALVHAVVVENFKDSKVLVFKKKRRKQYKKTRGHRQELTRVRIEDISIGISAKEKPEPAAEEKVTIEKVKEAPAGPKKAKKAAPAKPEKVKKAVAEKPVKTEKKTETTKKKAAVPAKAKKPAPPKPEKKGAVPKPKVAKPAAAKAKPKAAPKKAEAAEKAPKAKKVTKTKEE